MIVKRAGHVIALAALPSTGIIRIRPFICPSSATVAIRAYAIVHNRLHALKCNRLPHWVVSANNINALKKN